MRLILLLLCLTGCAAPQRVVIVSLDGFRHDYPDRAEPPTFDRLATEGAKVGRLIPPDPSQTFPGHATLATGVSPERHGIVNNRFWDRKKGAYDYADAGHWYDADPLWIHAERHGLRAHVFHWVGSAGPREGVEASEWRPFKKIPDDERLAGVLAWLAAPPATRPRLLMSYWAGCDKYGHSDGPAAPSVTACITQTDARLARLVNAIAAHPDDITLFVVSDHGMTPTQGEINPVLALADTGARVVNSGPIAHVYTGSDAQLQAARTAAAKVPHLQIIEPKDRHPTRTGDLILRAEFGYRFNRKLESTEGPSTLPGHHGHDPQHPDMGAILYTWGKSARPGARLDTANAVDLVPTVCNILGIPTPANVEGRVLTELTR